MEFAPSARTVELKAKLVEFDNEIVRPAEPVYRAQRDESGNPHFPPPVMEELKVGGPQARPLEPLPARGRPRRRA